ncbi:major facilitator superfamily domain-containing protein [Exophiala viscosa]|uniref:major facilitator superfamily domain-containing protein n=1 Tax=Exophiala viscosa TaxID=2486360 RepID=UPI0021A163B1|nr:major facilitator superfamily domain-containing protein [Exophiala viscosa]
MAHLVVINTWGVINSFGVFQTYYVSTLKGASADISWIGSMQVFFLFSIGVFTGSFLASISTTYTQLFFTQGVCIGIGMGCLFCPIVAVVSTYFRSRRNLAMGIAISGLATGGIVFPLMVRELLPRLGFAWTMRCLGFVQLASLLIANAFTRTRVPPRRAGPLIEWNAFRDPVFTFFALGSFFNFWGVYFAFYYYPQSINLLMIINGIGAIGRIVPGLVADRWCGPLNVIKPATAVIRTEAASTSWAVLWPSHA